MASIRSAACCQILFISHFDCNLCLRINSCSEARGRGEGWSYAAINRLGLLHNRSSNIAYLVTVGKGGLESSQRQSSLSTSTCVCVCDNNEKKKTIL